MMHQLPHLFILLAFILPTAHSCLLPGCGTEYSTQSPLADVHRAAVDGSVTLDCKRARECIDRSTRCEYSIEWLRLAGCSDARVPVINEQDGASTRLLSPTASFDRTRPRFLTSDQFALRVESLEAYDSGLWACQLLVRPNNLTARNAPATAHLMNTFMVHVRQRRGVTGNAEYGGITCMDVTGNYVRCREDQICARQTIVGATVANAHQHAYGCVSMSELPPSISNRLGDDPHTMCHSFSNSRFCQQNQSGERVTPYSATSSQCCYCFTDDCNQYAMREVRGELRWDWSSSDTPDKSVMCYELQRVRDDYARYRAVAYGRAGDSAVKHQLISVISVSLTILTLTTGIHIG